MFRKGTEPKLICEDGSRFVIQDMQSDPSQNQSQLAFPERM